jgi:hypothetical protein
LADRAGGEAVVEFGIRLGAPAAEPMGDRFAYYREMLEQAPEAFS